MNEEATRPVVVAIDGDADALRVLERQLVKRYGDDCDIRLVASPAHVVRLLVEISLLINRLPADWALERRPLAFETSVPGVFAVGDVRHGSLKRVASAAGDGAAMIASVHRSLGEMVRA